jgi:hypothetical protein
MNTRCAGEDFYFLQQLKKTSGVDPLKGTTVYPSPRPSHRVPFGTGRSVSNAMSGDEAAITFYRSDCFQLLRDWLNLVTGCPGASGETIMSEAERISPLLSSYLDMVGFPESWGGISRMKKTDASLLAAFHEWFDGLKTMKLIHHFSTEAFPRCGFEEGVPPLLKMAGLDPVVCIKSQLELLRRVQS